MLNRETAKKIQQWLTCVRGSFVAEKRRAVHRLMPVDWMTDPRELYEQNVQCEQELILVVEIPARELESMMDTMEWYKKNIGGFSMERLDKMVRDDLSEKSLREQHQGLREAWEKYQVMLALCSKDTYN